MERSPSEIEDSQVAASGAADDVDAREPEDTPSSLGLLGSLGRMVFVWAPVSLPLRGLAAAFAALKYRNYRLIWFGAMLSNIGTWIANLAKSWLVYEMAGPYWLGVDTLVTWLPMMLLLPFSGVLADRFDQRRILQTTNLTLMAVSGIVASLNYFDMLELWHLLTMSCVLGTVQAVAVPANQSLLPRLVDKADLSNAVALNAMQFNISRAIGPAIGGYALATLGATGSFALNATSFVAILIALLLVRVPQASIAMRPRSVLGGFTDAFAYLRTRPDIIMIELMVLITGLGIAPVMYMLPPLARAFAGEDVSILSWVITEELRFSLLLSSYGLGAILGAMALAARARRAPAPWRAFPTLLVLGALQVLIAKPMWHFGVTMLLVSLTGMMVTSTLNRLFAVVLGSVPAGIRGRMSSIHVLTFSIGLALGGVVSGYLVGYIGIFRVFESFGLMIYAGAAILALCTRHFAVQVQHDRESLGAGNMA
jgi:MFS family permease